MEITDRAVAVVCITIGGIVLTIYGRADLGSNCFIAILLYLWGNHRGIQQGYNKAIKEGLK